MSDTRWESRIDALKPLRYKFWDIYDTLIAIANYTNSTGESGNKSRIYAKAIATAISSLKFVVSLVVWYDMVFEINMANKKLQAKELIYMVPSIIWENQRSL